MLSFPENLSLTFFAGLPTTIEYGSTIFGYNTSGPNHGSLSNMNNVKYYCIRANPNIIFNNDLSVRSFFLFHFIHIDANLGRLMVTTMDVHSRTKHDMISNVYFTMCALKNTVSSYIHVAATTNVFRGKDTIFPDIDCTPPI